MNPLTDKTNADVLSDPRPCGVCRQDGPTYRDPETGRCYCPACLEMAVDAASAERALSDASDVYDVLAAFDKALGAAPAEARLLRDWIRRFPQFTDDLTAVGFAWLAFGWRLNGPEPDNTIGREVAADWLGLKAA